MTDKQRQNLIGRIRQELSSIDEELTKLEEITRPISPENAIGRVSRMDAIGNKMINEKALALAQNRKINLELALSQSDSSEFGLCMMCMAPIPIERFIAIPEASLCTRCASR
jgi:DnaK suppressor protein